MTGPAYDPSASDQMFDRSSPRSKKAAARAERRAANKQGSSFTVKPLVPKNDNQCDYIDDLNTGKSVMALGPAGVGKTYIAGRIAAQRLRDGKVAKIIVSRVCVSKREHAMGFLPGNIDKKMEPWMVPVFEGIRAEVSATTLEKWKTEGRFEIVPFEHMRGRTFDESFIILDEAQNAAYDDLKLFLTRTGMDSQVVVCGDPDQTDIFNSGLEAVANLAEDHEVMDIIEFTEDDVVRSPFAKAWVKAFAAHERKQSFAANLDTSASKRHSPAQSH